MKSLLRLTLSLFLAASCFMVSGCSEGDAPTETTTSAETETETETEAPAEEAPASE